MLASAVGAAPDLHLIATADDLQPGMRLLEEPAADVLLVDLGLPGGSGLELIGAAKSRWPDCDVMVISVFGDQRNVVSAIRAGATGYLVKDGGHVDFCEQIRIVRNGGSAISPTVARQLLDLLASPHASASPRSPDRAASADLLTPQERQVLMLANKGYTYDEVAQLMGVSRTTVLTYVKRCYRKLHVNSKTEALYEARRAGVELG